MASVGVRVFRKAFDADVALLEKQTDRATAVGLRAVAQQLVRAEKKRAPVLKAGRNSRAITRKQVRTGPLVYSRNAPVAGLLRSSVKASRARKKADGYRMVVGPGGGRVNLYKNKIERKYGFAKAAHDEVMPQASTIMGASWGRAMGRAR